MTGKKKLPIGIENFKEFSNEDFYYVDKTSLIKELLSNWGKVNLFTRPRRFGKSLNMSMLKNFFELGDKTKLFEGLAISKETKLCEEYMGKFPVISVSLKSINAPDFEIAKEIAVQIVNEEAAKKQYLLDSDRLSENDKNLFRQLLDRHMPPSILYRSLKQLSELLEKHHGSQVIMLIDEYDVPLAKAFDNGYYDEMVFLIRNLFEQAMKTNESLKFAVLTGCMRISRESIFTGFNNTKILSITDVRFDEYFGFTDGEVRELLAHYDLSDYYEAIKEWYDGYRFGNVDVYCPWDVLNYCDVLRANPKARPENYWSNTSSNDMVRHFIQEADNGTTKREIERLVAGEIIEKEIHQELTYRDLYTSIDHIWSVLFTTGYLTQRGMTENGHLKLAIPNMEIRHIFTTQIMSLFRENVQKDGDGLKRFCDALKSGNAMKVEEEFGAYLRKTISIRDTFVQKQLKENFYHGMMLGILSVKNDWGVSSNRESGDGYSDILIEIDEDAIGIVIEMKYAQDGNLDKACEKALEQVDNLHYEEELVDNGMKKLLKYGIACYKKRCKVRMAEEVNL